MKKKSRGGRGKGVSGFLGIEMRESVREDERGGGFGLAGSRA